MANKSKSIYKIFWFISYCLWASHVAAVDVLNQGDVLNSSASLVSRNGFFTLKFYNLSIIDDEWYLSIFYTTGGTEKPCWLANRKKPIKNDSGVLLIDGFGNLMIKYTGGNPIVLYSGQRNTNVTAILKDNGNFVLREATSSGTAEQVLWQSFDSPTDSFLPEMKLGQNLSLTSWFTASEPIPGAFTLKWVSNESQLVVERRGVKYWTSGELNNGTFENLKISPTGKIDSNFTNLNKEYLTFKIVPNGNGPPGLVTETTSLSLEYDGTIVEHRKSGGSMTFKISESCDGNNTDSGCERWKGPPKCRSHGEKFQKKEMLSDNSVPHSFDTNKSLSFSDCLDICWKNCSCFGTGTSNPHNDGTGLTPNVNSNDPGCLFWYGPLKEIGNGEEGGTVYHMIIPGPPGWKEWIWIVSFVPATFIIILLLGVLVYLRWRKLRLQEKFLLELMTLDNPIEAREIEIDGNNGHNLKVFSVSSIMDATNCFSTINKLGEGGFGPVYKGKLSDGPWTRTYLINLKGSS
ncbi:hypothetical protein Q3G72_019741 [Acer saccharum]|nr:hypothetical protein Q3G72_019741 [Acer saccharum]